MNAIEVGGPPSSVTSHKPTVSLVLGSGGARGYAHIGVIEELLAQGFEIRSIAGSSMGALIGGVYAAGKLDAYRDWVEPLAGLDVLRLVDWTLSGGGLIKGDRIIGVLHDMIGDIDIEDLPISYTAVAVDLHAQREVWFSRGSLFDAIRASISIPTVFRPYHHEGRLLVDGGLLNPLPISPTLRDMTDWTIGVDVNAAAETLDPGMALPGATPQQADHAVAGHSVLDHEAAELAATTRAQIRRRGATKPVKKRGVIASWFNRRPRQSAPVEPGLLELFGLSLDVVQETITRFRLAAQPPDLLITIPRNVCTFYEFHRAEEVIELGRQRTREALARWHVELRRRET